MKTEANIPDPDGFYSAWLSAQEGLDDPGSADFNARLVLLLANQCGNQATLLACIEEARASGLPIHSAPSEASNT
ncbi:DUF2783 domain-containing protein [Variovorax sp. J22P168]|uniref:DUF2783 domain-containing protein n=1 Tax=Variovorax jilinensis TaxID=3053513 RepID=UPI002578FD14|nr:DUF2783 domain-containing protein [Variovorax sp. J22P168]MDM0011688.1 DUF2783 domain-containing protein [Variovorax sp. J22P168]